MDPVSIALGGFQGSRGGWLRGHGHGCRWLLFGSVTTKSPITSILDSTCQNVFLFSPLMAFPFPSLGAFSPRGLLVLRLHVANEPEVIPPWPSTPFRSPTRVSRSNAAFNEPRTLTER